MNDTNVHKDGNKNTSHNQDPVAWIKAKARGIRQTRFLLVVCIALGLGSFATWALCVRWSIIRSFTMGSCLAGAILFVGVLVCAAFHRKLFPSNRELACRLDEAFQAKSRLESALETEGSKDPLAEKLRVDCGRFYKKSATPRPAFARIVLVILAIGMISIQSSTLWTLREAEARQTSTQRIKDSEQEEPKKEQKEKAAEMASLMLNQPRPYYKASVMDEIIWQGNGDSLHGFERLKLEVAINGEPPKLVDISEAPLKKKGKIRVEDALYPDEFGLKPYDMITYSLVGWTTLDQRPNQIIRSTPQFILVRQLREDLEFEIRDKAIVRNSPLDLRERLIATMNRQFIVINAEYSLLASRVKLGSSEVRKQIKKLAIEQGDIVDYNYETVPFATEQGLTDVKEHIEGASAAMELAQALLGGEGHVGIVPAKMRLQRAGMHQQKAIVEILAAIQLLGERKKLVIYKKVYGTALPKPKMPFRDDQEYIKPKLPPEDNPEVQLTELMQDQDELMDALGEQYPDLGMGGDSLRAQDQEPIDQRSDKDGKKGPLIAKQGEPRDEPGDSAAGQLDEGSESSGSREGKLPGVGRQQVAGGGARPQPGPHPGRIPGKGGGRGQNNGGGHDKGQEPGGKGRREGKGWPSKGNRQRAMKALAQKQAEITEGLGKLAGNKKLEESVRRAIAQAQQASDQTAQALEGQMPTVAMAAAKKTQGEMDRAMRTLQEGADKRLNEELRQSQKAIRRAQKELEAGNKDKAKKAAGEALARIHNEAIEQHAKGRMESAKKLASLAESIAEMKLSRQIGKPGDNAEGEAAKSLERAESMIAETRHGQQSDATRLAQAMSEMQKIRQELLEMQKEGGKIPANEAQRLTEDLEMAASDVQRAAERNSEGGGGGGGEVAKAAKRLRKTLSRSQFDKINPNEKIEPEELAPILTGIRQLLVVANQELQRLEKAGLVRVFNPDEVPAEYRSDVKAYFERLSEIATDPDTE